MIFESSNTTNQQPIAYSSLREQQMQSTAQRMGEMFTSNQILGRLQTIGCVAVEITQKCNLDCTLCYLSEHSQQVSDIPIEEIFRRLDDVLAHFGPGTHVQITGGDPTLRKHTELIEIIRYADELGLYTALFTNGIAASRKLLRQLADAGLRDVAFHVDTTQRRPEGQTEQELNAIREEYLERTRGLGLMVIFNTTVHHGNFHEIPDLVSFFRHHADAIGLVSWQLQAETGRGEWGSRDILITKESVQQQIEKGSSSGLSWDAVQVGHQQCHSYLPTVVTNSTLYAMVPDKQFFADFLDAFDHVCWDRQQSKWAIGITFAKALLQQPRWWWRFPQHVMTSLFKMRYDLIKSRGKIHQLTFFVQNFMDAEELQQERINACSFMVMTHEGPISMCQHNAKRDDYILSPLEIRRKDGSSLSYQPFKENQSNKAQHALKNIAIHTQ